MLWSQRVLGGIFVWTDFLSRLWRSAFTENQSKRFIIGGSKWLPLGWVLVCRICRCKSFLYLKLETFLKPSPWWLFFPTWTDEPLIGYKISWIPFFRKKTLRFRRRETATITSVCRLLGTSRDYWDQSVEWSRALWCFLVCGVTDTARIWVSWNFKNLRFQTCDVFLRCFFLPTHKVCCLLHECWVPTKRDYTCLNQQGAKPTVERKSSRYRMPLKGLLGCVAMHNVNDRCTLRLPSSPFGLC